MIEWKRVDDYGQPPVGALVGWLSYEGVRFQTISAGRDDWEDDTLFITADELAELLPFDRIAAPPNPLQVHIDALREAGYTVTGPAMTMTLEPEWLPMPRPVHPELKEQT